MPSFLLDWELTKLCNLDCSYCPNGEEEGEWAGHDNTTEHPSLAECLQTIDFMYEYVDVYMQYKKPSQRKVVLNVYGGESLFHPDIVKILEAVRAKHAAYKDRWYLTVTCTTNAIVGKKRWAEIVSLIDEFTISYHSENNAKQKNIFKKNVLKLKDLDKKFKSVIVMHNKEPEFNDCLSIIDFFKEHDMRFVAKPLDGPENRWSYTAEQYKTLKTFWFDKNPTESVIEFRKKVDDLNEGEKINSINEGRVCCGGRRLSLNGDLKTYATFVPKQGFQGWACSVNWFFLFVQQLTKNVYTNKDCRTSTTGRVEPLGTLTRPDEMITTLKTQLSTKTMPVITCVKEICQCGFCAPKATDPAVFKELILRNVTEDVFK